MLLVVVILDRLPVKFGWVKCIAQELRMNYHSVATGALDITTVVTIRMLVSSVKFQHIITSSNDNFSSFSDNFCSSNDDSCSSNNNFNSSNDDSCSSNDDSCSSNDYSCSSNNNFSSSIDNF
ncbi:hypothetical protein WMY93_012718 [Mugilogobius chulae]|uniref:Uncharacterized protein n=1 Tax=Mugilogobius chulae TaxID=88201 RepID=A0AAW0P205_9GOBI